MPNSPRFEELKKRISELDKHLLPGKPAQTGKYTKLQYDKIRGYRLLTHAEIEAFIEDIARGAATKKLRLWFRRKRTSYILFCLTVSYHTGWAENDNIGGLVKSGVTYPKFKKSLNEILLKASAQYILSIKENHGIKIENLKKILIPIGIDFSRIDPNWLTLMENFGRQRGEVAHSSIGMQKQIDPFDEKKIVDEILQGLNEIDLEIQKCEKRRT